MSLELMQEKTIQMSKPFNIHDWQAKQIKQRLTEQPEMEDDKPVSGTPKERLVQTIVNVFSGRLGNWYSEKVTNMTDVDNLFKRDREAIANIIRQHLRDVTVEPDISEMNTLGSAGAGSSITTGDSMAYATPKIFDKKRKED